MINNGIQYNDVSASRIIFRLNGTVDVRYKNGLTVNYGMNDYQSALVNRTILADTAYITREMPNDPIPARPDYVTLCIFIGAGLFIAAFSPLFGAITVVGSIVLFVIQRARYASYWRNVRR
jgi:hypothetical protein